MIIWGEIMKKNKFLIISGVFAIVLAFMFGINTYIKIESDKKADQEHYPYPQIYEAFKNDCEGLIDSKYKLDTDNGYYIKQGFLILNTGEKKTEVKLMINQFEAINEVDVYFSEANLTIEESKSNIAYIRFDRDKRTFVYDSKYKNASASQKQAFEEEMIERLKSC